MSNEQLIEKFINKELTEEEKRIFRQKFKTDKYFAKNVRNHLDALVALKTLCKIEHPVKELSVAELMSKVPDAVKRWIKRKFDIPSLLWEKLNEDIQQALALFFVNARVEMQYAFYSENTTKGDTEFVVEPKNNSVLELVRKSNIIFSLGIFSDIKENIGNYHFMLYDNELKKVREICITVDGETFNKIMNEQNGKMEFQIDSSKLHPGLYYWSVRKEKEYLVENRKIFLLVGN